MEYIFNKFSICLWVMSNEIRSRKVTRINEHIFTKYAKSVYVYIILIAISLYILLLLKIILLTILCNFSEYIYSYCHHWTKYVRIIKKFCTCYTFCKPKTFFPKDMLQRNPFFTITFSIIVFIFPKLIEITT